MNRLSYIRFLTYGVILAILALRHPAHDMIQLSLAEPFDEEAIEAREVRRHEDRMILGTTGFPSSKRSGLEIVAIATATAAKNGVTIDQYWQRGIRLEMVDGRLRWWLHYWYRTGISFTVSIDDDTGEAVFTTAPM